MTDMTDNNELAALHSASQEEKDAQVVLDLPTINQDQKAEKVPAVDVALSGRHLIEASAGTGKTWTLTGIVLRLLIEARRAPEQIIATTFTRAAAAEMRQRIHDRLVDFYQLLQWVNNLSADQVNKGDLYPNILQVTPESGQNKTNDKTDSTADADSIGTDELNQDLAHDKQLEEKQKADAKKDRAKWLIDKAKYARLDGIMQDPINLHLVGYLLDNVKTYPMTDAIRRTALVLTTLDKLFVGTLDSLAQKWLAEYSSETGHQQGMAIIEDSSIEQVTDSIIHDELRQFQSRLYHEQPKLYALMEQQGKLTAVEDHKSYVNRSLNFISAPIDEVQLNEDFDFNSLEQLLQDFAQLDLTDIQPYLNPDYRKSQGFNGRSSLHTRFEHITEIHQLISEKGLSFESYLSDDATKLLGSLRDAQFPSDDGKIKNFNKNKEKQHQVFFELETISQLMTIMDNMEGLNQHILSILANLNRHIVLAVRARLPVILEERGETTFSLQMVRLNQALTGRQGEKLARYIRHHYPVALIDESQDINGEQAIMIESIYLPKNKRQQSANEDKQSTNTKSNQEFLLLVGDPKQAIYGFRGGDVANYNYIKSQFDNKHIWTLDINRRSNKGVIDSLNCWFGMPTPTSTENRFAELGSQIYYQHITAAKLEKQLSWFNELDTKFNELDTRKATTLSISPVAETDLVADVLSTKPVSVLHLPYDKHKELDYDEHEVTARHIATLLNSGQTLKGKPIQPSDIGVLARAKKDLKRVEDELVKLNIPTLTTSDVSIFETIMAEDVAALLSAMLYPYRHDMINRVLTSHLYGLSIKEVKAMMTDHESGIAQSDETPTKAAVNVNDDINSTTSSTDQYKKSYQDFISYLKQGAQRWQNFGILSAMHYLLDKSPVQPQGVWQALAAHPEGDRHIMDLRHVMDILAQYGIGMGEHELLAWFRQNIDAAPNSDWAKQYPLPTESGVQLMTIHKSKGLEFPIVYVLGMGSASRKSGNKEDYGLYLYNAQQATNTMVHQSSGNQRRFSPVKDSATTPGYYTDIETQENLDERKRLAYVAFTRASELLYVVLSDPANTTDMERKPVFNWFDIQKPEPAEYKLPDRLKNVIGMVRGQNVYQFYEDNFTKTKTNDLDQGDHTNITKPVTEPIKYDKFSDVMRVDYFYGWAKTSFTALARQLDESTQSMAVVDERIDDATYIGVSDTAPVQYSLKEGGVLPAEVLPIKAADDIRFSFVKGANAGTFLHEIFEKINFTDSEQWSAVIDRAVNSYQLPLAYASVAHQKRVLEDKKKGKNNSNNNDNHSNSSNNYHIDEQGLQHQALMGWIDEVLHTPLLASGQPLINISSKQRLAEMKFNMGMAESFRVQQINALFEQYLPNDIDKHLRLTAQSSNQLYRYLRGEIDLVYQHAGKFYVVDYKSNFLGNSLSSYNEVTLKQAMSKAGYWLQAAIYQVALHRFLSMRIADYQGNEAKYLGPVEYVFLRGTYSQLSEAENIVNQTDQTEMNATRYGLVTWDIPIGFVKALDELFGKPQ
ncbi:UvrD-helicase domain-containing protein [Psychrobacter phenylpyruvicus]|uniref:RecBCD enzyme subunit RecB n=1 Tax=Psychrobacter phenylpyruvicus TaxID=29432 RepID=A0A379LLJ6_9GAMM|nr:UvrD-helicase domain-containing protein [Psychrobacter phenylpyruvicus]SUD90767.1 Exodeoxyribonuclease V beta chain [Psychrobacter phenylpyruvicus]